MKLTNALITEALVNTRLNTLYSLTESDLKVIDKDLTEDDLNALMESFKEDPELLVEFLGTIAGLGGKAAKYIGSKLSSFGSKASSVGDKASRFSNKKAGLASAKKMQQGRLKDQKSTRKAHTNAVKAYGKSLKGGDPGARKSAYYAMVSAREASRKSRGRGLPSGPRTETKPTFSSSDRIYKRIAECILKEAGHSKKK